MSDIGFRLSQKRQHGLQEPADHTDVLRATGVLAETVPRYINETNSGSILTSGTLLRCAIYLPAVALSTITFISSGTALTRGSNADSHLWFCLTDSNGVQVAATADDTSTAWAANSLHPLNIANIASGASATYTPPTAGLYYVCCLCVPGTGGSPAVPTLVAMSINNAQLSQSPRLCGNSTTGLTTPSSFPTTHSTFGAPNSNVFPKVQIS